MKSPCFDALELRDPADRESALMRALVAQLTHAKAHSPAQARRLAGVDPRSVSTREALAELPILRKHELLEQQRDFGAHQDPFAGFSTSGWAGSDLARSAKRVFQSPGPIYEPQGHGPDRWRMARAMYAAGFRPRDLIHVGFSFHLTPAGAMMEEGALTLGCTVFPAGVGNTELQLRAMHHLRPRVYAGTPSGLKLLLERNAEAGSAQALSVRQALVGGEAFPPSLREWLDVRGVSAYQCYATADVGLIAYETEAREGLVLEEELIAEIVDPDSGRPVPDGQIGEVVVTTFDLDYPLIRFGTGDLSCTIAGYCPTGRTQTRIKGWLGRVDQTTKVRGIFVHPGQIAEIVQRHPCVIRAQIIIEGEMADDHMTLHAEVRDGPMDLEAQIKETVRQITRLRASVKLHQPGELGQVDRVIEDRRTFH